MKIVCDSCGTKYSISDDKVRGKVFKIRCKKCSHIIVVRGTNDAAAAPAAAEGGWHLVVDGDQVGPLPEADIRARLDRGEISGETYVWKEGFSDWLKLSTVPEFADVAGGKAGEVVAESSAPVATNGDSSGRQSSPSGLFGTVGGAVAASAGASPSGGEDTSDVFAAPAPVAARAGGGDLFASSTARPSAEESRWPGAGGGGAAASAAGHDGGRVENLTGQRHENSVLFSLSNLQSLAMPSAAPKASGSPSATSAATSDGSGLIDIRAMAATTLGAPSGGGGPSFGGSGGSSGDDLPAFGAFSSAAPVLLPLPSSSGPPKWVYPVIGVMVLLVLGIGVMAYKIIAAPPPRVVTETVSVPAPAPPPGAAKPSSPVAAADPAAAAKPSTIPDENLPPRAESGTPAPAKADGKSEGKSGSHHGGSSKGGGKKGGASDDKKGGAGAVAAAAPAAAVEPEAKKPAKGSLDDLLQGALSSDRPRQGTQKRDDDSSSKKAPAAEAPSAGPLSKGAVVSGMNAVRPKVNECYAQYKVPGTVMVNVVIGKNGKVSSATVVQKFAGTPTGSCVERAIKTASFPPSDGLSTPYPFQLK